MNKTITLFIVLSLIVGSLGAVAYQEQEGNSDYLIKEKITLDADKLIIKQIDQEYIRITSTEYETLDLNPGKPILPKIIKTYELPFGAHNIKVTANKEETITRTIEKQIQPSPAPLPLSPVTGIKTHIRKDAAIYESDDPYPSETLTFDVGVGLNKDFDHVTFVTVHLYPVQYMPKDQIITIKEYSDIQISYDIDEKVVLPIESTYDLVIISPSKFTDTLQPLIDHKNSYGMNTFLKTTEEIYDEYQGADPAEQIKYFIKDAIETNDISYVLLAGGLKSTIYAKPRDNANIGFSGWHVPVRYSNLQRSGDPGYITDLYYADIYKIGGEFDDWDLDGDGIYAEWPDDLRAPEDLIDLRPDVAVGRLAFSTVKQAEDVVNKIIQYETTSAGSNWFKKMIAISGDGFLDQFDLNIQWNTTDLPTGEYTIKAQSKNPEEEYGPVDEITITVDKSLSSNITFNHDDHLNPALIDKIYPAPPIAEIVSVSDGNILGNTDVVFEPSEGVAYCNTLFWWANVSYVDEVLTIRGKSYDPKPYGNITSIRVWVENSEGDTIFSEERENLPTYYEGEWVTGEESVNGRGGALHYMPDEFEKEIVWCSAGNFNNPDDVITSFSEGYGFAFFSGHGSPGYWGDQYPGIPGNRQFGSVHGLQVSNIYSRPPFIFEQPLWPMKELSNTNKLPITVVGGCHNSQFNVSAIPSAMHLWNMIFFGKQTAMWTYGNVVPQCWSWYLVQLPETGSIATIGNTGLGWGWEGEFCTVGAGDGWISSEFFKQYGEHYDTDPFETLGQLYQQTQTSYVNTFKDFTLPPSECWWSPDFGWDAIDQQAVEQWVLLGDPSLRIGGYS